MSWNEVIAMSLLEMSISGAVFIFVVIILRTAAINYLPKKTFLALWGIVLFRLLIPVRIPSEISVYSWLPQRMEKIGFVTDSFLNQPSGHGNKAGITASGQKESDGNGAGRTDGRNGLGWNGFGWNQTGWNGLGWNQVGQNQIRQNQGTENPSESGFGLDVPNQSSQEMLGRLVFGQSAFGMILSSRSVQILGIIWAVGCSVCLLFFIYAYIKCRFRFSVSLPVENDFCQKFLVQQNAGRLLRIRQSKAVKAPLTYGLFHPVILMPENTDWDNTRQLEYVLTHECIHIKRFDAAAKMVLVIALAVHWFNPFVWVMYILCNRDLELSCDEMVVRTFGEAARAEYARILINMEVKKRELMPLCNSFSKNSMEERIMAIMKTKKRTAAAVVTAAVLICGATGVFATSAAAEGRQEEAVPQTDLANREKSVGYDITNISLNLSDEQAEAISDAVCGHMEWKYEGLYTFSNYNIQFSNEAVNGDTMSFDVDVTADMTLIRNPKKSPYAKGMREAIAGMKNAARKKEAKKLYRDYLKEVMPYYKKPEETGFLYQAQMPIEAVLGESDFEYQLFYRSDIDGEILGSFEQEEKFTESLSRKDGKAYVIEETRAFLQ